MHADAEVNPILLNMDYFQESVHQIAALFSFHRLLFSDSPPQKKTTPTANGSILPTVDYIYSAIVLYNTFISQFKCHFLHQPQNSTRNKNTVRTTNKVETNKIMTTAQSVMQTPASFRTVLKKSHMNCLEPKRKCDALHNPACEKVLVQSC